MPCACGGEGGGRWEGRSIWSPPTLLKPKPRSRLQFRWWLPILQSQLGRRWCFRVKINRTWFELDSACLGTGLLERWYGFSSQVARTIKLGNEGKSPGLSFPRKPETSSKHMKPLTKGNSRNKRLVDPPLPPPSSLSHTPTDKGEHEERASGSLRLSFESPVRTALHYWCAESLEF